MIRHHCVASLILLCCLSSAWAADGRIPVASAPVAISTPGSYYLTQDLSASVSSGAGVVLIQASNVELDLNGHSISNASDGAAIVVAGGTSAILVRHGTLLGNSGLQIDKTLAPADSVILRDLEFRTTGGNTFLAYGSYDLGNLVIENCTFYSRGISSGGAGIIWMETVSGGRIRNNVIQGDASAGFCVIVYGSLSRGLLFENNTCVATGGIYLVDGRAMNVVNNGITVLPSPYTGAGISVGASNSRVERNLVTLASTPQYTHTGITIYVSNVVVEGNSVTGFTNSGTGLNLSSNIGCTYLHNRLKGNSINLSSGTGNFDGGGNVY